MATQYGQQQQVVNYAFRNLHLNRGRTQTLPYYQRGYSPIEFAIWLGLAIIFISVAFGIVGPMMTTSKATGLLTELGTFQLKIREAYNGQQDGYQNINDKEVISAKAFPTNLSSNGERLLSTTSGAIDIQPDPVNQGFSIEYAAVSSGVCRVIVSKIASSGNWNQLDIAGNKFWAGSETIPSKKEIEDKCGNGVAVAMKFYSNSHYMTEINFLHLISIGR